MSRANASTSTLRLHGRLLGVPFASSSLRNAVETRRKGKQRAERNKREILIEKHREKIWIRSSRMSQRVVWQAFGYHSGFMCFPSL